MKQIKRIAEFEEGCCITQVLGKGLDDAVSKAENSPLGIMSYYVQEFPKGQTVSLLCSYMRKEKE